MTDYYDSFEHQIDDDIEFTTNSLKERNISKFTVRFNSLQNIVKISSPLVMNKHPSLHSSSTLTSQPTNKLSVKPKTRITPIIKEKTVKEGGGNQTSKKCKADNLPEGTMNPRVRDCLDNILESVILKRRSPALNLEELRKTVIEFALTYRVKFPKNRYKIILVLLYCIIMGSRLKEIYFDVHLLSVDLDIPYRNIINTINENLPPITSNDPLNYKLISAVVDVPRTKLLDDYCYAMTKAVEGFEVGNEPPNKEGGTLKRKENIQVDSVVIDDYRNLCIRILDIIARNTSCEYEQQFCITPDKVYIYGIFEIIRQKTRSVTERSICDYLSGIFKIPRVTVEKMKRWVVKCRKTLEVGGVGETNEGLVET